MTERLWSEQRALLELGAFGVAWPWFSLLSRGDRGPVLVLPGFAGSDGSTLRLIEHFKPTGPNTVEWSVTANDPSTWVRPWTFAMNLTKKDQSQQPFEYACHEGNYGLRNILSAARAGEKAQR